MMDKLVKEYYCQVWQIFKTVKLKEQDHSYQHLSCTSPSLQLRNSQVVKKGKSEERSKKARASNANKLYIKRRSGGCGLVELESAYDAGIVGFYQYIKQGQEGPTRLLQECDAKKTKHSLQKKANLTKQNIWQKKLLPNISRINLSPALKMRRWKNSQGNQRMDNFLRGLCKTISR